VLLIIRRNELIGLARDLGRAFVPKRGSAKSATPAMKSVHA
jgi:hypothetical protein